MRARELEQRARFPLNVAASYDRYYQAYNAFFTSKLQEKSDSIPDVLEKYVFSRDANLVPGKDGKAPLMISRFLGGILHPLIHAGYGAEFFLPGLVSEGD